MNGEISLSKDVLFLFVVFSRPDTWLHLYLLNMFKTLYVISKHILTVYIYIYIHCQIDECSDTIAMIIHVD